jgi:hypothetical protein
MDDIQAWGTVNVAASLSKSLSFNIETQARLTDDVSRLSQVSVRPSIGWRVADASTLSLGYAYLRSDLAVGVVRNEHRIWQQAAYRIAGVSNGVSLFGRTRLEQRFVKGSGDTGWRLRQQLRLTAPLGGSQVVLSGEPFFSLDDTAWGQRQGFEQVRTFAGVNLPLSGNVTVEPGYLTQIQLRRGEGRINHIASMTLNVRL